MASSLCICVISYSCLQKALGIQEPSLRIKTEARDFGAWDNKLRVGAAVGGDGGRTVAVGGIGTLEIKKLWGPVLSKHPHV